MFTTQQGKCKHLPPSGFAKGSPSPRFPIRGPFIKAAASSLANNDSRLQLAVAASKSVKLCCSRSRTRAGRTRYSRLILVLAVEKIPSFFFLFSFLSFFSLLFSFFPFSFPLPPPSLLPLFCLEPILFCPVLILPFLHFLCQSLSLTLLTLYSFSERPVVNSRNKSKRSTLRTLHTALLCEYYLTLPYLDLP
ncbi:hypothetical protein HDV57DRAFT_484105 [Trichoderma longibrachiatum]